MRVLKSQRGFTIVEVMVAAVILVIVAVALLGLYGTNFGWIMTAGRRIAIVDEAKAEIDEDIAEGTSSTADSVTFSFGGSLIVNGATVTVTGQAVEKVVASPNGEFSVTLRTFVPTTPTP